MLVGRYGSTAKRTATMILADNRTVVGNILKQGNFEHSYEDFAYVPNFGKGGLNMQYSSDKLTSKPIGKNKFIDSSDSEGED